MKQARNGVQFEDVPEQTISAIWQSQWLTRDRLQAVDGRAIRVVYRGRWTYGLGPDFRDAMLVFDDGPLVRGDIEVHRTATDWLAHGHEHDERYQAVVLHVTLDPRATVCRRLDGEVVPQLALASFLPAPVDQFALPAAVPLGALGDGPCAGHVVRTDPERLRDTVRRAGQQRLSQKAATAESGFLGLAPDQCFFIALAEALGYAHNRRPFRALAEQLPLPALDALVYGLPFARARHRLAAVLLGVGGLLEDDAPSGKVLAPESRRAWLDEWTRLGQRWLPTGGVIVWELARVRPQNHPARRLLGLAHLLARDGPARLAGSMLVPLTATGARPKDVIDVGVVPDWTAGSMPGSALIGPDRALEIAVNVVVVQALARAAHTGDGALAQAAAAMIERLPAGALSRPARSMVEQFGGQPRLHSRSALEHQGLLHLHGRFCIARRCYECPVAATVSVTRASG